MARVGYASKGAVYFIAGLLTLAGSSSDQHGAFTWVREQPFGRTLLVVLAIGLLGYALWRLGSGVADWEGRGDDAKGLAIRAGSFARGIIYCGFALEVFRIATRGAGAESSDANAQHWTARLMHAPFGRWLVAAAGLGILIYGLVQLRMKLSNKLDTAAMGSRLVAISRFGIGARAVVFLVIGASIFSAALRHDASRARGTEGALERLGSFGPLPLAAIGLGLAAYGVYAILNARYRRM
jgi:hypothetical protein